MYKKIVDYIERVGKKPERTKIGIMWSLVAFCMIIVIGIWWASFTANRPSQTDRNNISQEVPLPDFQKQINNVNKIFEQTNTTSVLPDSDTREKLEIAARNYLKEKKLADEKNIANLKIKTMEKSGNNWYLNYEQFYKDIPVNESNVSFLLDGYMNIIFYESNFDPDIKMDTDKKISADEAYNFLIKSTGRKNLNLKNSSLIIFRDLSGEKTKHYLAWKINALSLYPPYNNYYYFVDAKSGRVISYYSVESEFYHP